MTTALLWAWAQQPGFGEGFTLRELLAPINLVTGAFGAGAINAQVPTESTQISG